MQFLADESCDVAAVAEVARGAKDPEVLRLAREQHRVLLTEDKDFGWHVYVAGEGGVGVVLIRFPAGLRRLLGAAVVEAVERLSEELGRSFTVIEPGRVRVSTTPPHSRTP